MLVDYRYHAAEKVRSTAQMFVYPLQKTMAWPGSLLESISENLTSRSTLRAEVEKQTNEIRDLSLLANQSESLAAENNNLRKLLNLQQQSSFKTLGAEIIFNPTSAISQKIVINRGIADDIKLGMPVAGETGIMGQVVRVFEHSSEVALLEDPEFSIPIQVARNGVRGAIFGMGRGEPLELRYISSVNDLDVGDSLTTSGIDGTYPPGLPVAIITKIERSSEDSGAEITCSPATSINRYRHLMVIFYQATNIAPPPPATVSKPLLSSRPVLKKKK